MRQKFVGGPRARARSVAAFLISVASVVVGGESFAAEPKSPDAFARVIVDETSLRAGPGVSHRATYEAHRGDIFPVDGRQGAGYWLRVTLPDGRSGWVLGDTVEPISVTEGGDAPRKPGLFAPPPLATSRGGFAILGGILEKDGYLELKPAFVLAPTVALEPYVGMALSPYGNRLLYGVAGTIHFAPDWAIEPYASLGMGALSTFPNADQLATKKGTVFAARAGGGLLLALRYRILIRAEAHHLVLFQEDSYATALQIAGGLGVYF